MNATQVEACLKCACHRNGMWCPDEGQVILEIHKWGGWGGWTTCSGWHDSFPMLSPSPLIVTLTALDITSLTPLELTDRTSPDHDQYQSNPYALTHRIPGESQNEGRMAIPRPRGCEIVWPAHDHPT